MIKAKYDLEQLNKYTKKGKFTCEKHPYADIFIYGYTQIDSQTQNRIVWDDININLRGLIVDHEGNVISRAFQKFFTFRNYVSDNTVLLSENQLKKIKSNNFRVYEKVDGTFSILYWINDTPYLATQRSFKSPKAFKATEILHKKYSHLIEKLDRKKTYIFEAIYPETKVVVDYGNEEKLYLIGVLDTKTGKELELEQIGFETAKEYTSELKNLKPLEELQNLNLPNKEGFVVKYDNGDNIKVKFPWYKRAHKVVNQIIAYKNAAYLLEKQLKDILRFQSNILTQEKLWKHFNNGGSISDIEKNLSDVLYSLGAEHWIQEQYKSYKDYINDHKSLDKFDFDKDIKFDFDSRIGLPESESVIWNRISRLINTYD